MRRLAVLGLLAASLTPVTSPADDVTVHHVLFRSMATGSGANDTQLARCAERMGDRTYAIRGSDLDYRTWGIGIAEGSGLIADHNAVDLGPGFLCSIVPDVAAPDVARAYAYFDLPGFGELEVEGPCRPTATVNTGETFWHCAFHVEPDPEAGIVGGTIATNSVLVLTGGDVQWITGSLWTGYIATRGLSIPEPVASSVSAPAEPFGGEGGSFFAFHETTDEVASVCPGGFGRARSAVTPPVDPSAGLLDLDGAGEAIGSVDVCHLGPAASVATVEVGDGGLAVRAAGRCVSHPSVLGEDVSFQACSMHLVPGDGTRSGTLVGGGLVSAGDASASVTPMTWTMFRVRS